MKKIPWLNEGLVGFFEYDIFIYNHQLVARNLEQLQKEVSHLVLHQNFDRVSTYIRERGFEAYLETLSDEEKETANYMDYYESHIMNEEYRASVKQLLLNNGEIYPDDISIDDLEYNTRTYTEDEVAELRYFVDSFPTVSQIELEDIYLRQKSENTKYLLHRETVQNAELSAQNYESNLEVSELLCQIYEEKLAIEEQLISNSEMIVDLYEKVNITE